MSSLCITFMLQYMEINRFPDSRVGIIGFRVIRSFFVSERLILSWKRANRSRCSLKKSGWANRSLSLFNMSDFERKSEERKSEFPTLHGRGTVLKFSIWGQGRPACQRGWENNPKNIYPLRTDITPPPPILVLNWVASPNISPPFFALSAVYCTTCLSV